MPRSAHVRVRRLGNRYVANKLCIVHGSLCGLSLGHLPALQVQLREKAARRIKDIKSDVGRDLADFKREAAQVDRKVERLLAFIEATEAKGMPRSLLNS